MKVTQAGYPCVALMGSTMSKAQEELLRETFGNVIVMLDGDDAGRVAAEGITVAATGRLPRESDYAVRRQTTRSTCNR